MPLQQTYQKFPNKLLKKYRWKSQIEWKTLRFLHQSFFLIKMTLWSGRMQFLQPRPEIFNTRSKKIVQCTKMIKINSIFQKKNLKCFYGHKESSFHNFVEKFSTRGQKFIAHSPKRKKKQYFFLKISFWKNVRMGTKKAVFTTSPTVFRQNAKTLNSKSEKSIISSGFRKIIIRKYVFLDTLNAVVTMPPKSFQRGGETYSLII